MIEDNDTKAIILNSAVQLFSIKGYKETSVREISKEAGVNVSMISYYFGGKEGLLEKIVLDVAEGFTSYIDQFDLENIDELLILFEQFLKYLDTKRSHVKILFSEMGKDYASLRPIKFRIKQLQKKLISFVPIDQNSELDSQLERKIQVMTDIILGMIFSDYIFDFSSFQEGLNTKEKEIWREERIKMLIRMLQQIAGIDSGKINIGAII